MAATEDLGRCVALARAIRLAIWNELKAGGVADAGAMELIERIMSRLDEAPEILAVGRIAAAEKACRDRGFMYGMADETDHAGLPCQSVDLGAAFAALRGAS